MTASEVVMTLDAHSTADTANWDPTHPRFFSGTNCTASGSPGVDQSLISKAELDINGQPVNSWPDPSNPTKTPNLSVTFDSTHFADGSAITIAYKVTDTAGDPAVEKDVSASVYNEGYCLGNHTFGFNILVPYYIADTLTGVQYTTDAGITDHESTILADIPDYTVFYIMTHANNGGFGDCYDGGTGTLVAYTDVGTAVTSKTINEPPYNFAFIDGCHSAGAGSPESDGASAFGISGQDRAFLGWDTFVWCTFNVDWDESVWNNMAAGETLYDAMLDSTAENGPPIGNATTEFGLPEAIPPVYVGDPLMKLHGVYLGSGADQWFRAHLH